MSPGLEEAILNGGFSLFEVPLDLVEWDSDLKDTQVHALEIIEDDFRYTLSKLRDKPRYFLLSFTPGSRRLLGKNDLPALAAMRDLHVETIQACLKVDTVSKRELLELGCRELDLQEAIAESFDAIGAGQVFLFFDHAIDDEDLKAVDSKIKITYETPLGRPTIESEGHVLSFDVPFEKDSALAGGALNGLLLIIDEEIGPIRSFQGTRFRSIAS